MKWYAALLIVECRVGKHVPELWDQQVRLIHAANAEEAYAEANTCGRSENTVYFNTTGERVVWKFVGLGELIELPSRAIRSGIEVFSTLTLDDRPRVVRKRALAVFWTERHLKTTAAKLLRKELTTFAPR